MNELHVQWNPSMWTPDLCRTLFLCKVPKVSALVVPLYLSTYYVLTYVRMSVWGKICTFPQGEASYMYIHTYVCMYVHTSSSNLFFGPVYLRSLRCWCWLQVSVYSREGVLLGAISEMESWPWTSSIRPGKNINHQVVCTYIHRCFMWLLIWSTYIYVCNMWFFTSLLTKMWSFANFNCVMYQTT